MPDNAPTIPPGICLLELNDWLQYQLGLWQEWAPRQVDSWTSLNTGNEAFHTLGILFAHAFTPLHRYADGVLGEAPHTGEGVDADSWDSLHHWAQACISRHRQACMSLTADSGNTLREFVTRSAGTLTVTQNQCLAHAATHCAWHLGGISHLLRAQGIAPPQRSDLVFWAAQQPK